MLIDGQQLAETAVRVAMMQGKEVLLKFAKGKLGFIGVSNIQYVETLPADEADSRYYWKFPMWAASVLRGDVKLTSKEQNLIIEYAGGSLELRAVQPPIFFTTESPEPVGDILLKDLIKAFSTTAPAATEQLGILLTSGAAYATDRAFMIRTLLPGDWPNLHLTPTSLTPLSVFADQQATIAVTSYAVVITFANGKLISPMRNLPFPDITKITSLPIVGEPTFFDHESLRKIMKLAADTEITLQWETELQITALSEQFSWQHQLPLAQAGTPGKATFFKEKLNKILNTAHGTGETLTELVACEPLVRIAPLRFNWGDTAIWILPLDR